MRITLLLTLITLAVCSCASDPPFQQVDHLHGKNEIEVISKLGAPTYSDLIKLEHGVTLPELYIQIHNTYPPPDPKIEGTQIKELRWAKDGYTYAVFLHLVNEEWVVLDTCKWKDGVTF